MKSATAVSLAPTGASVSMLEPMPFAASSTACARRRRLLLRSGAAAHSQRVQSTP